MKNRYSTIFFNSSIIFDSKRNYAPSVKNVFNKGGVVGKYTNRVKRVLERKIQNGTHHDPINFKPLDATPVIVKVPLIQKNQKLIKEMDTQSKTRIGKNRIARIYSKIGDKIKKLDEVEIQIGFVHVSSLLRNRRSRKELQKLSEIYPTVKDFMYNSNHVAMIHKSAYQEDYLLQFLTTKDKHNGKKNNWIGKNFTDRISNSTTPKFQQRAKNNNSQDVKDFKHISSNNVGMSSKRDGQFSTDFYSVKFSPREKDLQYSNKKQIEIMNRKLTIRQFIRMRVNNGDGTKNTTYNEYAAKNKYIVEVKHIKNNSVIGHFKDRKHSITYVNMKKFKKSKNDSSGNIDDMD